ncbi:glutamate racemase [Leptolyngbya cf. ectocarpi LEGE 11479]|uniref:Glutamate racemase n=1 Tax=Leptolyngbya cf. ectocarpi LEGE 11479 TaxID=1828722 RepID=A0A928ZTL1_LEPEC|nr:glutamate racemase [Leptolyngbya ectocarpi]MBE9066044.1 glutamate racemase [Leptolyngbya cf. ectocarpi LEGE 11479]
MAKFLQMPIQAGKIGVFDSGVGGLTVLREIMAHLPSESLLYFGDTARVPYGNRTQIELLRFVREIITWMQGQGVKMVVMACNTSSALALEIVQAEFDIPILGIILPGARAAAKAGRRIGVISTVATAQSNAYKQAILEALPMAKVWQVGCPDFVPLIEQSRIDDPYTRAVATDYLKPLMAANIDTLVYGCTHYPHLSPLMEQILPPSITVVNPAHSLVAAMAKELDMLGLRNTQSKPEIDFYVSGDPGKFAEASERLMGFMPEVRPVSLSVLEGLAIA